MVVDELKTTGSSEQEERAACRRRGGTTFPEMFNGNETSNNVLSGAAVECRGVPACQLSE